MSPRTILHVAPTAVRALQRYGDEYPNKYDLSKLRVLGSVGEPINPEAWLWYYNVIGKKKCYISDTWWQTETGGHCITGLPGVTPMKPGSAVSTSQAQRGHPGVGSMLLDPSAVRVLLRWT